MPKKKKTPDKKPFSDSLQATLTNALAFLFVFFLPTQFGKHFFLPFSYISGVRIDYLAPTIYLTDILAFLLIVLNIDRYRAMLRNQTVQRILFLLSLTLIFSISRDFGLYKFLKVMELLAVGSIFVSKRVNRKTIFKAFFAASALQLYIVLLQLCFKHSLNGDFYFLGERPLTLSLPGIAKAGLDGMEMLRPYGTFSHPNSMAGFFLAIYSFYLFHKLDINRAAYWLFIFILSSLIILSFSKIAIAAFLGVTAWYSLRDKSLHRNNAIRIVMAMAAVFISSLFFRASTDPLTVEKRISLIKDSLSIISTYPILGVGLGNYLFAQADMPQRYSSFILQPVHNVLLLIMAEVGIPISLFLFFLISRYIMIIPVLVMLFTGMFDHYWITLQQNWLLIGVVWGL